MTVNAARRYLEAHWRTPNARPVVTHVYSVREGWVPLKTRELLSPELATTYRAQGFVMVRARFHFRSADVTLSAYLDANAPPTVKRSTPAYAFRSPYF